MSATGAWGARAPKCALSWQRARRARPGCAHGDVHGARRTRPEAGRTVTHAGTSEACTENWARCTRDCAPRRPRPCRMPAWRGRRTADAWTERAAAPLSEPRRGTWAVTLAWSP